MEIALPIMEKCGLGDEGCDSFTWDSTSFRRCEKGNTKMLWPLTKTGSNTMWLAQFWLKNSCLKSLPYSSTMPLRKWFNIMGTNCLTDPQVMLLIQGGEEVSVFLCFFMMYKEMSCKLGFSLSGEENLLALCWRHSEHHRGWVPRCGWYRCQKFEFVGGLLGASHGYQKYPHTLTWKHKTVEF